MPGAAWGVFRLVVVKARGRQDFDDVEGLLPHHRAGELLAGDERLAQHLFPERPIVPVELLGRMLVILLDDEDADARALRQRLDDVGSRQHVAFHRLEPRHHHSVRDRDARPAEHRLGEVLLDGERGRQHPGMRVGDADDLQNALDGAVLARPAVQEIERNVGFERLQHAGDVTADVDAGQPVILLLQDIGAGFPRAQRDLPLRRPSAHQDRDVLASIHPPRSAFPDSDPLTRDVIYGDCASPIRRISHSSSTPELALTRSRTSSPRFSMSAALAFPRLIRKLQCICETWASPSFSPRQPA